MAEPHDLELRANRMDLVSRWADDLAHEIKNPLHAMVINLELVKRRAGSGEAEPVVERAQLVEAELDRVHTLVESLLRLVRPWADQPFADVEEVFRNLLPALSARARVRRVEYSHEGGPARVAMAPGALALTILNLVDNAIDATPAGGRLATTTGTRGDDVLITVVDTGSGLTDDLGGGAAFEAGATSQPGRPGLGLAVAARLVGEAGGELTLGAGPGGGGTEAVVRLRRAGSA